MEIKYQKKLEENLIIGNKEMIGISEEEIKKLEKDYKISLPQAYKEYLFLAGKYDFLPIYDESRNIYKLQGNTMKTWIQEALDECNIEIQESYLVFAECIGQHGFTFFQLNNSENPKVFKFRYTFSDNENEAEIINLEKNLSEYVDSLIEWEKYIQDTGAY